MNKLVNNVKPYKADDYDVIVVGAGHAGCEAALAAARMKQKTLLITLDLDMVAFMPCNPSIGGPAKGTVVREIDALGGEMGKNIDKTYVQMRMLNTRKGPAVQALRAQADKKAYHNKMKDTLESQDNLTLTQGLVNKLVVKDGKCTGIITNTGAEYGAKSVVLCAGTAARGKIIIGELMYSSGPNNSLPAIELSNNLSELGFHLERFKTGTPPRVNGKTIDYSATQEQPGDNVPHHFSYETSDRDYLKPSQQLSCWLTYTNTDTHKIIKDNLDRAPMFTGKIEGVGPRYCPSIEDKIVRFADKNRHQLFLEPEGKNTNEWYLQGLSTSLPEEIQHKIVHSIRGLENATIMRPGYAIEYDVVSPDQLYPSLETKIVKNLFTAGQTNGTSGYEEAAGQGLIAGINAALKIQHKAPLILKRNEAYIGVLIDDLVTKGTNEPYRLLTSRAEYRLLLRNDNADKRLTPIGKKIGLISDNRYKSFTNKQKIIESTTKELKKVRLNPSPQLNNLIMQHGDKTLREGVIAAELLKRPYIDYATLLKLLPDNKKVNLKKLDKSLVEQIEINIKYEGYIKKEEARVERAKRLESKVIPLNIKYDDVKGISTEARQKLNKIEPQTIGQASRISGVNPPDIAILSVYIQS